MTRHTSQKTPRQPKAATRVWGVKVAQWPAELQQSRAAATRKDKA